MTKYTSRVSFSLLAALALSVSACAGENADDTLAQDSALTRDLASVNADTAVQPQLTDVPAEAPPVVTPPAATTPRPRPRPATPRPTTPAPAPKATEPATTPGGNTVGTAPVKPLGTIPSGTRLTLNSTDKVCTNSNKVGDRFTATVSESVVGANGATIPAGSRAVVEVTTLKRSENVNDKVLVGLRVVSLTFDGTTYPVSAEVETAAITQIKNSNDAKKVIGGAIIGAVIGQAVGKDTKGTVIGAGAGAAAGAAAAKATANMEGCLNNGAAIGIRLNETLTVQRAS